MSPSGACARTETRQLTGRLVKAVVQRTVGTEADQRRPIHALHAGELSGDEIDNSRLPREDAALCLGRPFEQDRMTEGRIGRAVGIQANDAVAVGIALSEDGAENEAPLRIEESSPRVEDAIGRLERRVRRAFRVEAEHPVLHGAGDMAEGEVAP